MYDRFIEHVARIAPDKIAMLSFDASFTFAKMNADINRLARVLLKILTPLPKVVAVSYQQMHPHWMLLMALSRIGVATASVSDDGLVAAKEISILKPDLVISDVLFDIETDAKVLVLDLEWYVEVVNGPEVEPLRLVLDRNRTVRVVIAAGTSAKKHRVDFNATIIEGAVIRISHQEYIEWIDIGESVNYNRLLPTLGLGSIQGFLSILSTWYGCGSVIMVDREQYPAAIAMLKPSLMIISPSQLQAILDNIPTDVPPISGLRLVVSAGYFSDALRDEVRRKLTEHMRVLYGTTECGSIAGARIEQMTHDDMAGWLSPSVDLQIVDDNDEEMPVGEIGNIRLKSAELVDGFYEDPEATRKQFRDGWFYPGDLGSINRQGCLRIFGRADELYNFGGDKFYAHKIDHIVKSVKGVKDAALFAMPNANGIDEPWLAIVKDSNFDANQVGEVLEKEFHNLPNIRAMWVDVIPRNLADHVLRYQLVMLASQKR